MTHELDQWLADTEPKMLIVGELQDGLVFENAYLKITGRPLSHWLVPRFARQSRHRLIFLTKSTEVNYITELDATDQVVLSWSVNAEYVSRRWELGTPLPSERFRAAKIMRDNGWPVRFRLDPMVPYPNWHAGYAKAIDQINDIGPEMVTLGALRASSAKSLRTAACKNGRDGSIFDYLTEEKDPSGFKYRISERKQLALFRFALDRISTSSISALCKEDRSIWDKLDLEFKGCHCLLGANDAVAATPTPELYTIDTGS